MPNVEPPVIRPIDSDGITAGLVGTIGWTLATVWMFVERDALSRAGHSWWLWVGLCGIVLGNLGMLYGLRRQARRLGR